MATFGTKNVHSALSFFYRALKQDQKVHVEGKLQVIPYFSREWPIGKKFIEVNKKFQNTLIYWTIFAGGLRELTLEIKDIFLVTVFEHPKV